jgi:NitT/TauT family transport system substrate-binding protein
MIRTFARLALAAIAVLAAVPAHAQSALTVIRVASGMDDNAAPVLYAQRTGMFRRAGLDVQLEKMNSGAAVSAAVAGGSIDIGKSSLAGLLVAHQKGLPFTLVAPAGLYVTDRPYGALVVPVSSVLHTAADFSGKTIAVAGLRDIVVIATDAWIDQHGGNSSALKYIELAPVDSMYAIEQGRIDAAVLINPMLEEAKESGKARVAFSFYDGIGKRFLSAAWFSNTDYVNAHRDVIAKFAAVMKDAEAHCNAHPNDTVNDIATYTGLAPELIAHMIHPLYPDALDPADIQPVIDTAVKYKLLDHGFDAGDVISPAAVKPHA